MKNHPAESAIDRSMLHRRLFLGGAVASGTALASAFWTTPGLFAEELDQSITPSMTEGPFYPDKLPLDTDNDLIIVNNSVTPAVGKVAHLYGKVTTKAGTPVRNAFVEIWQCDMNQSYLHSRGHHPKNGLDKNFQGYGRFLTNIKGEYYFRTIKPIAYSTGFGFRTPHIHVAVSKGGKRVLTTQLFIKDEALNKRDGIFRSLRSDKLQDMVSSDFAPIKGSKIGEVSAQFDIVLGETPKEADDKTSWGLGKSELSNRRRR